MELLDGGDVVEEMQRIVRVAGEDGGPIIKARINLAARRLKLSPRECSRLWYGQRKTIDTRLAVKLIEAEAGIMAARERRLTEELALVRARRIALGRGDETNQNLKEA